MAVEYGPLKARSTWASSTRGRFSVLTIHIWIYVVSLCDLKLFRFDNVINGNSRIKLDIADKYNFDFAYLSAL